MFKKVLLASAIAAISSTSFAMQAMSDDALSDTTGQDGLTVTITPPAGGITADIIWHDTDGYTGATSAGAVVIGDPLGGAAAGTHDSFSMVAAGGIQLAIDASGDVDSVTAGNQAGLRIGVSLPSGATIHTGDISVATSAGIGNPITDQTGDILNDMTITLGSGSLATVNLGNEPNGGAMIQVATTLTGGLSIANFALNDANSSGSIGASQIDVNNAGASTDLNVDIGIDATNTGLLMTVNTLGTGGLDVSMQNVSLGSATSMGDVEIKGLDLTNTTINVVGH